MKKYLIITLLTLPLLFSGCSSFDDIKVTKVKDVTYEELRGRMLRLAIVATVDNPHFFNVKIKNANMELRLNDRVIGTVTQVEQIELAGRKHQDYKIHVSIELKDIMSNLINLSRILMNETKNLNLSGTVQVKSFLYNKTFHIDRLSFQ